MELAFRENLKKMRGTKSKEKFSQELEMSRSNYSRIESGKSDPTIKTLEQIAKLTNSTLVVDLIPNEPTEPESEQVTLDLEMEEEIIGTTGKIVDLFNANLTQEEWDALCVIHRLTARLNVGIRFEYSKSIDVRSTEYSQIVDQSVFLSREKSDLS